MDSDQLTPEEYAETSRQLAAEGYCRPQLTNYRNEVGSNGKTVKVPKQLPDILDDVLDLTHESLIILDDDLVAVPKDGGDLTPPRILKDREVPAWIRNHRDFETNWSRGDGMVSFAELVSELKQSVPPYKTIERWPHSTPYHFAHYLPISIERGSGEHLDQFLNYFTFATDLDRELFVAEIATLIWGGGLGQRPAFVHVSESGRGTGKTKAAELISHLLEETPLTFSSNTTPDEICKRLLSKMGRKSRLVLIDNLKSRKFSWAELEGLITTATISGRQLYEGEGQRPNNMTFVITVNGPNFSRDMAQRVVVIKFDKPQYQPDWETSVRAFVEHNRIEIIGDILGFFDKPTTKLQAYNRQGSWEGDVLCRLPNAQKLHDIIQSRRVELDADLDEAEIFEAAIVDNLSSFGIDPESSRIRIPSAKIAKIFNDSLGENRRTQAITREINQMIDEGLVARLRRDRSRSHGRCFIYAGANAPADEPIDNKLIDSPFPVF